MREGLLTRFWAKGESEAVWPGTGSRRRTDVISTALNVHRGFNWDGRRDGGRMGPISLSRSVCEVLWEGVRRVLRAAANKDI